MKNTNMIINKAKKPRIYIVDFLNIFSDFREIKYKKDNIDFHSVKHIHKKQDTLDFFKLFFTRYIDYVQIDKSSTFLFVMKKLNEFECILDTVIKQNHQFNIQFFIIEDKYDNSILDKNKDDFLCQYVFHTMQKNNDCILISNDKYRDRQSYIKLFNFDISIKLISWNKSLGNIVKTSLVCKVNNQISNLLISKKYTRCTIPKNKLRIIL